jgi:hypothetical protein
MTERSKIMIKVLAGLVLVVLSLCAFANSMTKEISRDEHMYCTAGVMMAQGKAIYRDFSYVAQMPYHPLFYAALYKIIPSNQYLLIARLTSVACNIVTMIALFGIYRCIFGKSSVLGILLGLATVLIYVFNPVVDYANGHAWNNDAVTVCIVLSFWLLISTNFDHPSKYWRITLIGALLTFATFMRATAAVIQLAFLLAILSKPAENKGAKTVAGTLFLLATALIALWPAYVIARAPEAFLLNGFRVQLLNGRYLQQIGMELGKLDALSRCIVTWEYLSLLVIAAVLWLFTIAKHRLMAGARLRYFMLPMILSLLLFAIAFAMPTTWAQHLAMPVAFILISLAYPIAFMRTLRQPQRSNYYSAAATSAIILCAIVSISLNPLVLQRLQVVLNPRSWMPKQLHKTSLDIAARVPKGARVLTLAPLYALEGECEIYTELSAGPFVYRIGDRLTADELAAISAVAPKTLSQLVKADPPAAVIVALESHDLEAGLPKAVLGPNWRKLVYSETGPILYLKP